MTSLLESEGFIPVGKEYPILSSSKQAGHFESKILVDEVRNDEEGSGFLLDKPSPVVREELNGRTKRRISDSTKAENENELPLYNEEEITYFLEPVSRVSILTMLCSKTKT